MSNGTNTVDIGQSAAVGASAGVEAFFQNLLGQAEQTSVGQQVQSTINQYAQSTFISKYLIWLILIIIGVYLIAKK